MASRRGLLLPLVLLLAGCFGAACQSALPARLAEPTTGMSLVLIPAGSFTMGSQHDEPGHTADEPSHTVTLTRALYLGEFEVTQGQWRQVMGDQPSQASTCGSQCPVETVNWHEVQVFLDRLSKGADTPYRLPTEAEWEYACRAGTTTPFNTGQNLTSDQANYRGDFPYGGFAPGVNRQMPTAVGSFAPNAFGLFDMHGNVWEWMADDFCPYPSSGGRTDPEAKCETGLKSIRGGSWRFNADSARCAGRYWHRPSDRGSSIGFRVARTAH